MTKPKTYVIRYVPCTCKGRATCGLCHGTNFRIIHVPLADALAELGVTANEPPSTPPAPPHPTHVGCLKCGHDLFPTFYPPIQNTPFNPDGTLHDPTACGGFESARCGVRIPM